MGVVFRLADWFSSRYLSLLCLMSKGSTADKRVLIDYNVDLLQDALLQIFKL